MGKRLNDMKKLQFAALAAVSLMVVACATPDVKTARELAGRVLGDKASAVVFEQTADTVDVFELETVGKKVHIRANNANSMAVGLNHYIQNYCLANVSWYDYNPVELPEVMPAVPEKVRVEAELPVRFFLNYCTFGYTMPWWGWKEWERFIDWMALNGVNEPLAITGQEAVWQKVWRKYGMTDDEIRAFFVGPAHLPWQRMCNLDRWEGPLPQKWIDGQAELQKRILKRERALNMKPVLPAFAGHIPAEIADHQSQIDTFRVSYWGGFADEYRCTFLSPMDPLFARIQKDFLEEQTKLYGTDHIYGVDPFNEVDAPYWDPENLAKIGSGIFESMAAVDPDAQWLQMGWLFYADMGHWNQENIEAYLTSVPQGRMTILDYYCDYEQVWKRTNRFYGQNYIWCYLGNFGGMTGIEGDWKLESKWIEETKRDGGPGFVGIGSTLEGFGVNEPLYEFVLSKAWNTGISDKDYVDNVADRHLGKVDENYRAAWQQIVDKVSVSHSGNGSGSLLVAHPNLEGQWHWTTAITRGYDIRELDKALEILENVEGTSNYYEYDLTNLRRQVINNSAQAVRDAYTAAYYAGDREAMDEQEQKFLALFDQMDALLSTRKEFSLDDWIAAARSWGDTPEEQDYYEMNARTIVSVWGDSFHLCDYANRDWAGLMSTYYKPRWEMFFKAVRDAMDAGVPFTNSQSTGYVGVSADGSTGIGAARAFDEAVWDFECEWAKVR